MTAVATAAEAVPTAPVTVLPAAQQEWRRRARDFAEQRVAPRAAEMDRHARLDPDLRAELFDAGLMAVEIPKAYGGRGGTLFDAVLVIEELARVDPGVAVAVDVHNALVVSTILRMGSGDLKRRFLPTLARTAAGAFALSELGAGSDALSLETVATRVPGGFVINGRKRWTSGAGTADMFLVFARMAGEDRRRLSAFLVARDAPGLTIGTPSDQLGVRAASTADLILENVRVRAADAVGGEGAGRAVAVASLDIGRLGIAAQMVGLAQGALELAIDYAEGRQQFGSRIGDFQGVQFPIAATAARLDAARALTYDAVRRVEVGVSDLERMRIAATAKWFAAETADHAARTALDVHGGNGYVRDYPVERFLRDAIAGQIYEGTSNILLRTIFSTLRAAAGERSGAIR